MGQELGLDRQGGVVPLSDRFAETGGIPTNDDGGEQVEHGHAVVLGFARQVEAGRALRMLHPDRRGAIRKGIDVRELRGSLRRFPIGFGAKLTGCI